MESAPPAIAAIAAIAATREFAVRRVPWWRAAAHAVPALVALGISVYRAATLSITFDEGTTYLKYAKPGFSGLLEYGSNNHVLHSFLVWCSLGLFGDSLLAVRLPALLGTVLYLWATFQLCALLWTRPIERIVVMSLLCLNPLLLDFFCLARGYSLGLGLLGAAFLLLLRDLLDHERGTGAARRAGWIALASLALGLCCGTNYSNAFVCIGLGAGYLAAALWFPRAAGAAPLRWWKRLLLAAAFVVPGPAAGYLVLRPYLPRILSEKTYIGFSDSPADTVRDLLNATFFHGETSVTSARDIRNAPDLYYPDHPLQSWVAHIAAPALTAAMVPFLIGLIALAVWRLARRSGRRDPVAPALWLCGVALAVNWELFEIARHTAGVRYPLDRVVLYLVMLFILGASALALACGPWVRWLYLSGAAALFAVALARTDLRFTRSWRYDAGVERFVALIEARHPAAPGSVRIGGAWIYDTAVDFYRESRPGSCLQKFQDNAGPAADIDYFIYHPREARRVDPRDFRLALEDPLSGAQLLERDRSSASGTR